MITSKKKIKPNIAFTIYAQLFYNSKVVVIAIFRLINLH